MQSDVLRHLVEHQSNSPPCTPSRIAERLGLARSTVHDQLGYLVKKGFAEKKGRGVYMVTLQGRGLLYSQGGTNFDTVNAYEKAKTIHVDGKAVRDGQVMTAGNVRQVFDLERMKIIRYSELLSYVDAYQLLGTISMPKSLTSYALLVRRV